MVYVVIKNWQRDSGDCGLECIGVYKDFEYAQKVLESEMKVAKEDFSYLNTEEDDYAYGDMCWSIWEEGEYCYNHIDLKIVEKEVE